MLQEEYLNPFDIALDKSQLFNLSSGVAVQDAGEADDMVNIVSKGQLMYDQFVEQLLKYGSTKSFHDPISKSKVKLFKNCIKKLSVTKGNKTYVTEVNRNILAKLTSSSTKTGKAVNFEDALKYPLSPVPLSLAFPDGSKRHTQKSK